MKKKSKDILDAMIAKAPPAFLKNKAQFMVSNEIYKNLCIELNRKVKTYKGFRVGTHLLCPKNNAYMGYDLFI